MRFKTGLKRREPADGPAASAIQARGLEKAFGRTRVLHGLDFEVPWGQVLTVLGANGSGKTTLVKALATLTKPDAGAIRLAGMDSTRSPRSVRRLIGVVTHDTLLYDELTAYENLRFYARMFRLDAAEDRISSVAERMGVSDRLGQRIGTLSHGMKKRFSIARALLHDPRVLLMDEPETGLDQDALARLDAVIRDGGKDGRAVLMTTHNLERGLALGHRVAVLARGSFVYQDSVDATGAEALREAYFRHVEPES